jgi:formate dehydrogenase subunit gamma
MAARPGLAPPRPPRPRRPEGAYVHRFGATERNLHTIHGVAFVVMFASGLVLYLPMFAQLFSDRPLMKGIHLTAAGGWLTALALVAILGDRRGLRSTRRELERFDADDVLWLRRTKPAPPQGRFNAGQKAHAIAQAALAVLLTISGVLLWLGERDTSFRLPGTIALHDAAMFAAGVLVAGHVWMALSTDKLPALRGILHGSVPASYAASHHPKWVARDPADVRPAPRPGPGRIAAAALVTALGAVVILFFFT